jgi:hypothetical protein
MLSSGRDSIFAKLGWMNITLKYVLQIYQTTAREHLQEL